MDILTVAPGSRRGVVVMIGGLQLAIGASKPVMSDVAGAQPILWLTLAQALQAQGWIVIQPQISQNMYVGLPQVGLYNDVSVDTGTRFKAQTLAWWDHVVLWIKANYGNWPIVPVGFSWGGQLTHHIAANKASTITAYVTHHSCTVLSALSSAVTTPANFTGISTAGIDNTSTMLNAVTKPGLIGWGTSDPVVSYTPIEAIYNAASGAGRPVTSNAQASGHTLNNTDVTAITGWFTSTVNPLAPANL